MAASDRLEGLCGCTGEGGRAISVQTYSAFPTLRPLPCSATCKKAWAQILLVNAGWHNHVWELWGKFSSILNKKEDGNWPTRQTKNRLEMFDCLVPEYHPHPWLWHINVPFKDGFFDQLLDQSQGNESHRGLPLTGPLAAAKKDASQSILWFIDMKTNQFM